MCVVSFIYSTVDGGQSWTKKDINPTQATYNTILSMHFHDANNGVLGVFDGTFAYMGGMLTTSDGGATWTESYLTNGGTATGRVVQATSNDVYTGSPKGGYGIMELYKSFDNGSTWDTILIPDTCNCKVKDFDFINANEGAVVISNLNLNVDYIYSTNDGGVNWYFRHNMTSLQNYDFDLTENTGYLTGNFGQYYKLTGLLNIEEKVVEIGLFPNPAYDIINIQSSSLIKGCVVYDINGKIILEEKGEIKFLNVSNLTSGIYFIELNYGSKVAREKFIKN
jgi:hypothetical protein